MTATLAPPAVPEPTPLPAPDETAGPDRRRRPETDPAWARPALLALLAATALLYLWGLGAQGWANTYYSAAVQAGTQSWKAFFFGSTDASNFITVDKTPLSLWPMALSARVFGVNAWSILVPQALMGVATVGVTYAAVKRWFGAAAGLIAGLVIATTPIAALMFRFNNPDAALTLLMTCGAYALTRALEQGSTRWIIASGGAVGLAFLAKELQAFLVLPAFGLAYLIAGPPAFGRRFWQVIVLGLSTLVAAGWWVAIVSLWPASSRPYIGGSQNNSFFNVLFGYNGFGRLTGDETGSVGGGPAGAGGRWGATGWTRLFNDSYGGQASWLIPAALILGVTVLGWTLLRPRTDRTRAAMVLWGGWLFVTGAAISLGQGIIHEYYTVALAPAIGAVIGIGAVFVWRHRRHAAARVAMGVSVIVSAWWAAELLNRTPTWMPWLRDVVLIAGIVVGLVLIFPITTTRVARTLAIAGLVLVLLAPAAYTLSTVRQSQGGAIPLAGPAGQGGRFGRVGPAGAFPGGNAAPGGANGTFQPPGGGTSNGGQLPGGGMGGLLNGTNVGAQLTQLLQAGGDGFRWTAAAVGANNAASYQLASGEAIMAIGGFNGSDPAPSLAQFQEYVREGKVHYFLGGGGLGGGPGGFGGGPGSNTSSAISTWVTQSFVSRTVDGVTIYDLTQPRSSIGSTSDAI